MGACERDIFTFIIVKAIFKVLNNVMQKSFSFCSLSRRSSRGIILLGRCNDGIPVLFSSHFWNSCRHRRSCSISPMGLYPVFGQRSREE